MDASQKPIGDTRRISRRRMLSYGLAGMALAAGGLWPASAFGDARSIQDATIGGGSLDDNALLNVINAQLEKVDVEIAAQNWEAADTLIKYALAELGDRYVCPDAIDETGMKLIAANLQEREGRLDNAVRVRRNMLAARLEMFRSKTK